MYHHSTYERECARAQRLCIRVRALHHQAHRAAHTAQRRCAPRIPLRGVHDTARPSTCRVLRQRLEGLLLLLEAQLLLSSGSPRAERVAALCPGT